MSRNGALEHPLAWLHFVGGGFVCFFERMFLYIPLAFLELDL